jgi:hydrogenase expression/formation protein HypD
MKFLDEYRNADSVKRITRAIARISTKPHNIMEICGGQTHSIVKHCLDELLPPEITLIHGPGCPVCVTPIEFIDHAVALALRPNTIFCSFGDMVRVPGSTKSLLNAKSEGADIRMLYAPLDAVSLARQNADKEVIFFAVGFETTAPANALAVHIAKQRNIKNFSMLVSHVLVPPAIEAILSSPDNQVHGFLAAGHVCTIMGCEDYEPISQKYRVPIVVTGFEPVDILQGIYLCIKQLEEGRAEVENPYSRAVQAKGNSHAQNLIRKVFTTTRQIWRGIGPIPQSGLKLADEYQEFDAARKFNLTSHATKESERCISGLILQGIKKPHDCPVFATECNPENPLGAPMVSSEGACAAYYRYRRVAGNEQSIPGDMGKRSAACLHGTASQQIHSETSEN